ncbi:dihydrofolate reductase family protein [Paraflavitalea pollutisoli]|uniref:dihydrofolate reductase family protein n=1 Tax=Paraflavitalea pollutisoli TaxID=3034143 RepID=UPI0023EA9115|nr:dihydrofolate reductase family protein [Paraflavitalea sp. H1-2-19X]
MRKLIFGINITIDGCCDHTKGKGDQDVHDYFKDLIQEADLLVYGRKTYELMVPFWPDVARTNSAPTRSMNEFAQVFTATDKLVFSTTLSQVDEPRTRIVRTDPVAEIQRLKQEPGGDMLLGGVVLPSYLIEQGLVDEYRIVVQPLLAGEGTRLMKGINLASSLELKLIASKVFPSGNVALHYVKPD